MMLVHLLVNKKENTYLSNWRDNHNDIFIDGNIDAFTYKVDADTNFKMHDIYIDELKDEINTVINER